MSAGTEHRRETERASATRRPTAWEFNKEILFGEIGALAGAYVAALIVSAISGRHLFISGSLVPGTLLGGTIFWLAARVRHQRARRAWSIRVLARDVSYFTPAATVFGFLIYDPAIFFASHFLLDRGAGLVLSVAGGELTAFALFLGGMNAYRLILARTGARHL